MAFIYSVFRFIYMQVLKVKMDQKVGPLRCARGAHNTDTILRRLQVKPTNTEVIKAISTQIENLEAYGLLRNTGKGWIWSEKP